MNFFCFRWLLCSSWYSFVQPHFLGLLSSWRPWEQVSYTEEICQELVPLLCRSRVLKRSSKLILGYHFAQKLSMQLSLQIWPHSLIILHWHTSLTPGWFSQMFEESTLTCSSLPLFIFSVSQCSYLITWHFFIMFEETTMTTTKNFK